MVNIGFVGLRWGGHVADMLASGPFRSLFTITAACDTDADLAADFGRRHRVPVHRAIDEMLADPAVEVIGLFTGPIGRAELLRRIIRAGKDVMTTKPFELDPRAAREVLEEAGRLGRTIHLNSPGPSWSADLVHIREWCEEFDLGRPISCRGEMLASYREEADGRWLDDPELCPVAPVFRIGIYSISDLVRLYGPVSHVQAMATRIFTGRPTADNGQLGVLFANGAVGSVHASFCVENGQHYANSAILNFERGTVWRNVLPVGFDEAASTARLTLATTRGREVITREVELTEESGAYQWAAFHEAVTSGFAVPQYIDEIVHGVEILSAMARAIRTGQTEPVDVGPR